VELCELRSCSAVTSLVGCLLATGMIYQRHLAVHGRPCAVLWAPGRARARLHGGPVWPWTRPALHHLSSAKQRISIRAVPEIMCHPTYSGPADVTYNVVVQYVLSALACMHHGRVRATTQRGGGAGVAWDGPLASKYQPSTMPERAWARRVAHM
jgi:hypothetical protein